MPRHQAPKKDVASCESMGEPQAGLDPVMSEWGNPAMGSIVTL